MNSEERHEHKGKNEYVQNIETNERILADIVRTQQQPLLKATRVKELRNADRVGQFARRVGDVRADRNRPVR